MEVAVTKGPDYYEVFLLDGHDNAWAWDRVPEDVLAKFAKELLDNKEAATPDAVRFVLEAVARDAVE